MGSIESMAAGLEIAKGVSATEYDYESMRQAMENYPPGTLFVVNEHNQIVAVPPDRAWEFEGDAMHYTSEEGEA